MNRYWVSRLAVVSLLALACCQFELRQSASAPPIAPVHFDLVMKSFAGAAGTTFTFHATPDEISVSYGSDFGDATRQVWRKSLTAEQRKGLSERIAALPVDKMRERYVNPAVVDGLERTFVITFPDGVNRSFIVANMPQNELDDLAAQVYSMVPERYRR